MSLGTLVAPQEGAPPGRHGEVAAISRAEAGVLADGLRDADAVLLHFSGYGYARRGLCRWLVEGLARWKAGGEEKRLVTMFHEVYATGPIWRSSFWTASPQRRIARDLARLSNAGFVSSRGGQEQLGRLFPQLTVGLLPVFSNVGEPNAPRRLSERAGRAVVFGGRIRRRKVYEALERAAEDFAQAIEQAGVTEIVDIGPNMNLPTEVAGCVVRPLGPSPAAEVSAALEAARVGLIDYPGHVFTKSGIAGAYFAHRLPIVNTSSVGGFPSELKEGRHFASLERVAKGDFDAQVIADAGYDWYSTHGLAATAETFRACLT